MIYLLTLFVVIGGLTEFIFEISIMNDDQFLSLGGMYFESIIKVYLSLKLLCLNYIGLTIMLLIMYFVAPVMMIIIMPFYLEIFNYTRGGLSRG
ncbi:hypothetical protein IU403_05200 [Aerococcaceae bacterium zg-BR22]|uniref:hypothetical protein n=1 Tax=Aerococcaceae bacterium zg-1292 TaxID=2774330 RepID=UPI004063B4EC|nr:hypothetical protein [Aerococcaceae bacterium zg-BR22]